MARAPYAPTVALGLAELERRFNPQSPDWELVFSLVHDVEPPLRDLGLRWLGQTLPQWTTSPKLVARLLAQGDATARTTVTHAVVHALGLSPRETRCAMAAMLLRILEQPERTDGTHDAYSPLARALLEEIAEARSAEALATLLGSTSPAARWHASSIEFVPTERPNSTSRPAVWASTSEG
jgi:hypothetical protein